MKKILLFSFLMCFPLIMTAQENDEHRERIRALKTAYITEGLNLTPREAQQFWPIYNDFTEKRRELYKRERKEIKDLECMTEEAANSKLNEYVEIEREDFLLKKQYFNDLRKIFSAKKIMQLKKVEDEFNEKMMREYRARRAAENNK
ncbi:hypothetical protein [Salinimicrobium flavum]|uniref:Sensor of ECF-type sigma factor n=1 Tax=Salinimicrobium flavum TaxID=1737065 RepID=A0ABW5IZF0_9FLAO